MKITRVDSASNGEKIVDHIAAKMNEKSNKLQFQSSGDEIGVFQKDPIDARKYLFNEVTVNEIKDIIRLL